MKPIKSQMPNPQHPPLDTQTQTQKIQIQKFLSQYTFIHEITQPQLSHIIPFDYTAFMTAKQIWVQNIKDVSDQATQLKNKAQLLMRVLQFSWDGDASGGLEDESGDMLKYQYVNMFGSVGSRYTSNINPKFDNYDIKNNPNQAKNKIADVKTCTDNNNVNKNPITANTTKTEQVKQNNQKQPQIIKTKPNTPKQQPNQKHPHKQGLKQIKLTKQHKQDHKKQPRQHKTNKFQDQNMNNSNLSNTSHNIHINSYHNQASLLSNNHHAYHQPKSTIAQNLYRNYNNISSQMSILPMKNNPYSILNSDVYADQSAYYNSDNIQVLPMFMKQPHTSTHTYTNHHAHTDNIHDHHHHQTYSTNLPILPITSQITQLTKKQYIKQVPYTNPQPINRTTTTPTPDSASKYIYVKCQCICNCSCRDNRHGGRVQGSPSHQKHRDEDTNSKKERVTSRRVEKIVKSSTVKHIVKNSRAKQNNNNTQQLMDMDMQNQLYQSDLSQKLFVPIYNAKNMNPNNHRWNRSMTATHNNQMNTSLNTNTNMNRTQYINNNTTKPRQPTLHDRPILSNNNTGMYTHNYNPNIKQANTYNQQFEDDLNMLQSYQQQNTDAPPVQQYQYRHFKTNNNNNALRNRIKKYKTQTKSEQSIFAQPIDVCISPEQRKQIQLIQQQQIYNNNNMYRKDNKEQENVLSQNSYHSRQIQQFDYHRPIDKNGNRDHHKQNGNPITTKNVHINLHTQTQTKTNNQPHQTYQKQPITINKTNKIHHVQSQQQEQQEQKIRQKKLLTKLREQFSEICSQSQNQDQRRVSQEIKELEIKLNQIITHNSNNANKQLPRNRAITTYQSQSPTTAKVVKLNLTPTRSNLNKQNTNRHQVSNSNISINNNNQLYSNRNSNINFNHARNNHSRSPTPMSPVPSRSNNRGLLSKRIQQATKNL